MPDGQAGPVAGQADDADVVAEILAAELRPDAQLCRVSLEYLLLHLEVAKGISGAAPRRSAACRATWSRRVSPS